MTGGDLIEVVHDSLYVQVKELEREEFNHVTDDSMITQEVNLYLHIEILK